MGKIRFVSAMVPVVAIFAVLSLPAAGQVSSGGESAARKGPAPKAAPVQRGAAPQQAVRPGPQPGVRAGAGAAGYAGRPVGVQQGGGAPGYVGRPAAVQHGGGNAAYREGYAGRPGYYARYPGFARRNFGGHFYRGNLAWDRGVWRHEWHNGRYGWWWDVGGAWYFYDRPYDGPPTFISEVEVLDDPAMVDVGPPDDVPPPGAYEPVVVAPPPAVVVVPPPIVCVGPLCVR